jgi:hypothetical protein
VVVGGVVDEEVVVARGRDLTARQRRAMECLQTTSNTVLTDLIKATMKTTSQIPILPYPPKQNLAVTSLNLHNSSQQLPVQPVAQRRKDHIGGIQSQPYAKHVIEVTVHQTIKWCFAMAVVVHIISIAIIRQ